MAIPPALARGTGGVPATGGAPGTGGAPVTGGAPGARHQAGDADRCRAAAACVRGLLVRGRLRGGGTSVAILVSGRRCGVGAGPAPLSRRAN